MKILYGVQGTGNGHISRAMDIIPCLEKHGQVDVLVSGIQADLKLPLDIKYSMRGLSFIFGKKGGVDLWRTFARTNARKFVRDISGLDVNQYDLVINDFEPISAWACSMQKKKCISLSHQSAVLDPKFPEPDSVDKVGKMILQYYAPSDHSYGFHFDGNGANVFTPVIRKQVRDAKVSDLGHITVYLPAYDDHRILENLLEFPEFKWNVFSKHNKQKVVRGNITIQAINNELFTQSLASGAAVMCGAGFETPAEALYLNKKLLVIPMKNQYEQQLNAAVLKSMGVPVIKSLKEKNLSVIADWLYNGRPIAVNYPDQTQDIVDGIVRKHG